MQNSLPAPARLSRVAAAAAAKHPDCPDLRELVSSLTMRELDDAKAAVRAREEFDRASKQLDRKIAQTGWIAAAIAALAVARLAGVW